MVIVKREEAVVLERYQKQMETCQGDIERSVEALQNFLDVERYYNRELLERFMNALQKAEELCDEIAAWEKRNGA